MNQIIKNALALFAITAVAGFLLGAVYEGTKEARAEQAIKTQQKAYKTVFEEASDFEDVSLEKAKDAIKYSEKEVVLEGAVKALDSSSTLLGYVITVTAKEGYGGDIKFSVGVDIQGHVTGISYLSITETAGLGMKAKDQKFIDQYTKTDTKDAFIVNKDGSDGAVIDAIGGATITSRAVTKGVNAACQATQAFVNGGVSIEGE